VRAKNKKRSRRRLLICIPSRAWDLPLDFLLVLVLTSLQVLVPQVDVMEIVTVVADVVDMNSNLVEQTKVEIGEEEVVPQGGSVLLEETEVTGETEEIVETAVAFETVMVPV